MPSDVAGRRALVTGAAGFIGSNLVRELQQRGADVHALVRPGKPSAPQARETDPRLHEADLADPAATRAAVRAAAPELVFHLAAGRGHSRTLEDWSRALDATVLGTASLLDAVSACGCARIVHVGSSLEYGRDEAPVAEDAPLRPVSPRGALKAAAALVALQRAAADELPVVVVRPFSVYGPDEQPARLVPAAFRAASSGAPLPLAPAPRHDWVYVADVVEALVLAATSPALAPGEVVNVGTGVDTSNEDVVAAVARAAGRPIDVRPGAYEPLPWDSLRWVADIRKARRVLGWRPRHTLDRGLRATASWLEERHVVAR